MEMSPRGGTLTGDTILAQSEPENNGNEGVTPRSPELGLHHQMQFNVIPNTLIDSFFVFNGISTLFRLFNADAILLEEQQLYYLTHSWEDKGVHTFPKGICPKVNVIAWMEYELAYYDSSVYRFNHYTTRTPPTLIERKNKQQVFVMKPNFFLIWKI